jgi:hypothetical protein
LRLRLFIRGDGVWIWRSGATLTRGENELRGSVRVAMDEDHVAFRAVEQFGKDCCRGCRTVLAKDTLVCDAAGDLHICVGGDLMENLVEAGVVCGD